MKWFSLITLLALVSSCQQTPSYVSISEGESALINGIHTTSSDLTEPRAATSRFLKTEHGGIALVSKGAGCYLKVRVQENPITKYHVKIEWPNPRDPKNPYITDTYIKPDDKGLMFYSPEVIGGFEIWQNYKIRVLVFKSEDSSEPIDVLTQTFRSYVNTKGDRPIVHRMFRNI